MKPPAGLTAAGRRAHKAAVAALGSRDAESMAEPLERYARAADLVARLYADWAKAGHKSLEYGGATGQALVPHPLVAMIREAEKDAARFWDDLGLAAKRSVGRPAGAASAPDRVAAPPKLRSVK